MVYGKKGDSQKKPPGRGDLYAERLRESVSWDSATSKKRTVKRNYSGSTYILIGTGSIYGEKGTKDINTYHIMTLDFQEEEIHIWGRRWVPEFGMWTVFADNSRNTFPLPRLAEKTTNY